MGGSMRKILLAAGIVVASAGVVSTAQAEPTGNVQVFDCGGETVEISVAGRNGWIDGVKYQAVQVSVTDPSGATVFVKVYGGGRQLSDPDAITCTATDEGGFTIEVIAVPA
jgi:hypothetical protein